MPSHYLYTLLGTFKIMIDRIKCFIGLHKWIETIPSERECRKCNKQQARVIYPWKSSRIYWETK